MSYTSMHSRNYWKDRVQSPLDIEYADPRLDIEATTLPKKKPVKKSLKPDYDEHCDSCDQSPVVGKSGLCGACFFGEADCIDPNNW